jgi:hypothetical protein
MALVSWLQSSVLGEHPGYLVQQSMNRRPFHIHGRSLLLEGEQSEAISISPKQNLSEKKNIGNGNTIFLRDSAGI